MTVGCESLELPMGSQVMKQSSSTETTTPPDNTLSETLRGEIDEKKRLEKIRKAEMLRGSWELARLCKEFLKRYEGDWEEGKEKALARREKLEKERRLEIVKEKKSEIQK